jgi:hypothetical protein
LNLRKYAPSRSGLIVVLMEPGVAAKMLSLNATRLSTPVNLLVSTTRHLLVSTTPALSAPPLLI